MVCNSNHITALNNRGRFSKDKAERMVNEAYRDNAEGVTSQ